MKSVQGMFDLIHELRKETNHPTTKIMVCHLHHIRWLYEKATRKMEFKHELKSYLGWQASLCRLGVKYERYLPSKFQSQSS